MSLGETDFSFCRPKGPESRVDLLLPHLARLAQLSRARAFLSLYIP